MFTIEIMTLEKGWQPLESRDDIFEALRLGTLLAGWWRVVDSEGNVWYDSEVCVPENVLG